MGSTTKVLEGTLGLMWQKVKEDFSRQLVKSSTAKEDLGSLGLTRQKEIEVEETLGKLWS